MDTSSDFTVCQSAIDSCVQHIHRLIIASNGGPVRFSMESVALAAIGSRALDVLITARLIRTAFDQDFIAAEDHDDAFRMTVKEA